MAKRILAVDDSRIMREMVVFTLRDAGFEVVEAEDGCNALKAVEELDNARLNLIITDLNMPHMDGFEFIAALRQDPKYKYIPILTLTTESDSHKKEQGRVAGATGWIIKPFNPDKLIKVVNKVCL